MVPRSPGRALSPREAVNLPQPEVIHLIDSLLGWGGAENRLVEEILAMPGMRHVVVRIFENNELDARLLEAGVPVVALGLSKTKEAIAIPQAISRLRRLVKSLRPPVIHTSLLLSNLVGQVVGATFRPRVRVVSSLTRSGDPEVVRRYFSTAGAAWKLLILDNLARWVGRWNHVEYRAVGLHVKETSCTAMGLEPGRVTVIPRGVDVVRLGNVGGINRSALGLDHQPVFVNIARMAHANGQVHLIRAFEMVLPRMPDAVLLIAGKGQDAQDEVLSQIAESGVEDSVRLLGYRPDTPELMSLADVVVISSLTAGLPGVLLEAMAVGAPVVAFDVPGTREASDGERCASLVPPGNEQDLASAMIELYGNEELKNELVKSARLRVTDTYDLQQVAADLEHLLTSDRGE